MKASKEMVMVSLMYGVIARLGAEGNIFFSKCNGTNTHFCREMDYVAYKSFFGLVWTKI